MSLFVTFEGGEGCGKTTQLGRLAEALSLRGLSFFMTREPGGTAIGEQIRKILLDSENRQLSFLAELFLYAADRCHHVETLLRPALHRKQIVLCDRYIDATLAYQGYGRELNLKLIDHLNQLASGGLKPHLTFLLDAPAELALARAKKRLEAEGGHEGRFEHEELNFHRRVRDGYLQLSAAEPERFRVIDATQSIHAMHRDILNHLDARLLQPTS